MPPTGRKQSQYTEEELLEITRKEIIEPLTDREIAFCEYYLKDHNAKMALMKAGYKVESGSLNYRLRYKQAVVDYLAWLKVRIMNECYVSAADLLSSYAKMAYYDITDYVEMRGNRLQPKDFGKIDGQIIQEISQNASGGITIKFPDRIKAHEKLEQFMEENPYDWKRKMEEQKIQIMRDRLEIEKSKQGLGDVLEDDGFIEALAKVADGLFDDEEPENELVDVEENELDELEE